MYSIGGHGFYISVRDVVCNCPGEASIPSWFQSPSPRFVFLIHNAEILKSGKFFMDEAPLEDRKENLLWHVVFKRKMGRSSFICSGSDAVSKRHMKSCIRDRKEFERSV